MIPTGYIDVMPGGKSDTGNGSYDCSKQGEVVGIAFKNAGNQNILVEFGGSSELLTAGQKFTHFTNFPYINRGMYNYKFITTAVVGQAIQLVEIFVLKIVKQKR